MNRPFPRFLRPSSTKRPSCTSTCSNGSRANASASKHPELIASGREPFDAHPIDDGRHCADVFARRVRFPALLRPGSAPSRPPGRVIRIAEGPKLHHALKRRLVIAGLNSRRNDRLLRDHCGLVIRQSSANVASTSASKDARADSIAASVSAISASSHLGVGEIEARMAQYAAHSSTSSSSQSASSQSSSSQSSSSSSESQSSSSSSESQRSSSSPASVSPPPPSSLPPRFAPSSTAPSPTDPSVLPAHPRAPRASHPNNANRTLTSASKPPPLWIVTVSSSPWTPRCNQGSTRKPTNQMLSRQSRIPTHPTAPYFFTGLPFSVQLVIYVWVPNGCPPRELRHTHEKLVPPNEGVLERVRTLGVRATPPSAGSAREHRAVLALLEQAAAHG